MIELAYPQMFLLLLLPLLLYIFLPPFKGLHGDALRVPFLHDISLIKLQSGSIWQGFPANSKILRRFGLYLLSVIYVLLVVAAARPCFVGEPIRIKNEGRDILLVMDISTSMLEQDFSWQGQRLSRLNAVKVAATEFIDKRIDDRIGVILFGTRAYLQAPLTFDKASVKTILADMDAGMAGNSTSIGDALGLALKTFKDIGDKDNKVIILLTDGENNDGRLSMPQAVNLAKNEKIKIYTIGVGGKGNFMQSLLSYHLTLPSGLDEQGLKQLAQEAGGRYFRADDAKGLLDIYAAIDKLEPSSKDDSYVREVKELYYLPLSAAMVLVLIMALLKRRNG